MKPYESALTALAHPSRRRLLEALRRRPRSVNELTGILPISQPAVSQHLRVLESARLVEGDAVGTRRIYRLRSEGIHEIRAYIDSMWDDALDNYAKEAERRSKRERRRKGR